jgi:hypothetical protein
VIDFCGTKGLNYRTVLLSLAGMLIILARRQYRNLYILGGVFFYFGVMGAFEINPSSRIFFPASIAWTVLIAVVLVAVWDFLATRIGLWRRGIR